MCRKDIARFPHRYAIDIYIYYLYTQAMGWKIGWSIVKAERTENEAYDCEARI